MNDWTVTLKQLRYAGACKEGYNKVVRALQGQAFTDADEERKSYINFKHNEPISLLSILESNDLDDALWAIWCVTGHDRDLRLYAVACARRVQHLMTDQRSLDALNVAERFANGQASAEELDAAAAAAADAYADAECCLPCRVWAAAAAADTCEARATVAAAAAAADADATWRGERAHQQELFVMMINGTAPWQIEKGGQHE